MRPRIVIVVSHGFQARILLRTDIYQILRKNADLALITPNAHEPQFITEFGGSGVTLVPLVDQQTPLERRFEGMRKSFSNPKLLATANIKNERLRRANPRKYYLLRSLNVILGSLRLIRQSWLGLEAMLFPDRNHTQVFDEFKPNALITVSPGVFPADARLIRSAKRQGVLTLCVVQSWDNLTSKGYMGARPDKLIVWNDIMRAEAISYHEYDPRDIYIAGVPHFDVYARREQYCSRDQVFSDLGLDPQKGLIFFGTTASVHYPHTLEVIDILVKAVQEGRFVKPVQLLVRLHPETVSGAYKENLDQYERFRGQVIFDVPRSQSENMACDLKLDDTRHLGEMLLYSDVTINAASTLTIDACCHDSPVVNIGFDGYDQKPYVNSALRFYDYTHYKNIVKENAARIAHSPEEFIQLINLYLENRALDRLNRERVVKEQCYKMDGRASQRVAEYILKTISDAQEGR